MTIRNFVIGYIGILAALAALCLLVVCLEKKWSGKQYDERQKIARGKAYCFSFWVSAVFYIGFLVYLIYCVEHEPIVEPYLILFAGMDIQMLAFHSYCLATHSALPFSEKPTALIICYTGVGVFDLLTFFSREVPEVMPLTGTETSVWLNLLMGMFFLSLALMHLLGALIKEKE